MRRLIRRLRRRLVLWFGGRFRDRYVRLVCVKCRARYHRDIWPLPEAVPVSRIRWQTMPFVQLKCGHNIADYGGVQPRRLNG